MNGNLPDIVQKLGDFLNYFGTWFDHNIGFGLTGFIKSILDLFIKMLEFFIQVLRWLMQYL